MSGEYRLSKRQVVLERHILWVRRTKKIIPSVTKFRRGRPQRIKLTNVSDRAVYFPAHDDVAVLVPAGDLPRGDGYVRVDSKKYRDWQVLAYEGCRDRELFQRECELYEQWLVTQPPSVERPDYPEPQGLVTRPPQDSLERPGDRLTCAERWDKIMEERARAEATQTSGVTTGDPIEVQFPGVSQIARSRTRADTRLRMKITPTRACGCCEGGGHGPECSFDAYCQRKENGRCNRYSGNYLCFGGTSVDDGRQ
ncbi:hypothetical protein PC116_g27905 [Phytophthora cactorum]|nr:hypothetical protein Pcac1_g18391 [Phytophthora cactorum]KAG4223632.1 hypothetical protein PC116_g27905 [Phytophthora cactorum]